MIYGWENNIVKDGFCKSNALMNIQKGKYPMG